MRVGLAVASCAIFLLAGCSGGAFNQAVQTQASVGVAGARLTGTVHGGQQAITGAHVYLLAANTTGYGGAGIAASTSNASLSLLTSGTGRTLDSSGGATNGDYYVTTDSSGNFSISGDYTCTTGQQVYLYSLGGNPGSGANSAAGLMAVLGNCPAAGNFLTQTPYVVMNEVSTVAAAYAFAGFATDATHVGSSGTALALIGIANAFANAGNLVNLSTGVALATTPAGNGTVPQAEINTLGNILASCVNSNGTVTGGGSPTACYTLFTNALSGGSTGTQPGDTATAAINVAHNPAVNVASLYGLSTANPPFIGVLSQPLDWTVAVGFSGAGTYPSGPEFVAIDGSGDVWTLNQNLSVSEFSSLGRVLSGSTGYTGGGLRMPSGLAIDSAGDAWIPNYLGTGTVTEFSGSGSVLSGSSGYAAPGGNTGTLAIDGQGNVWVSHEIQNSIGELSASGTNLSGTTGYTGGGLNQPGIIGIDGSGNVWASNSGGHVSKFSSSGVALSGQSGYAVNQPGAGAVDSSGNLWITSGNSVVKMSNSGTILSGPNGYSGGGLSAPGSIVIDGAGNIWVADSQGDYITELSASGAPLSGASGFGNDYTNFSNSLAVDGSGNVWVAGGLYAGVAEFVGAAVPVITPIAAGLPTTPTADGSSNLGTRP